jgi:hypothetical protein
MLREKLVEKVNYCLKNESAVCWLDKGKDDITPELTPQLFQAGTGPTPASEQDESDKMASQFSADELKDMTTQIQDILKE